MVVNEKSTSSLRPMGRRERRASDGSPHQGQTAAKSRRPQAEEARPHRQGQLLHLRLTRIGEAAAAASPTTIYPGGDQMECDAKTDLLLVETDSAIYEIEFGQIQIEITGRCNMRCRHCRAANDLRRDMPVEQVVKAIKFARRFSPNYKEIIVSGGEPLFHASFPYVLKAVRENGGEFVTLTTNGSLLREEHLALIQELDFKRFMLSVSLDSLDPAEHDCFRGFPGAYDGAIRAIRLMRAKRPSAAIVSVRITIRPEQIADVPAMVDFVYREGCNRVSLSGIHPSGRAMRQPQLWMNCDQKRAFLETIYWLKKQYPPEFQISTNDPLKCIMRGYHDVGGENEVVFDGCAAAAVTFNVNADGDMTPCALLDLPIMNVFGLSIEEMVAAYQQSAVVKNMLDMNLGGKCETCAMKYQCGGCRARAFARIGDYLAADPDCWL